MPQHLIRRLAQGYRTFQQNYFVEHRKLFEELRDGQSPKAMLVSCCDSRVEPALILDAGPGDLFVARNIANLIPPYQPDANLHGTSAAVEFAIRQLEVPHVIIMGHGRCGGIHAALNPKSAAMAQSDFLGNWMRLLEPVSAQVSTYDWMTETEKRTALERISIRHSIANLRTFPFIKQAEDAGRLTLHGAWFDISNGELWVMDADTGDFTRPDR